MLTVICVAFALFLRAKTRNLHTQIISVENEVIWMCPEITDKENKVGRWINMTHEQFKEAADYWNKKERTEMPKEAL